MQQSDKQHIHVFTHYFDTSRLEEVLNLVIILLLTILQRPLDINPWNILTLSLTVTSLKYVKTDSYMHKILGNKSTGLLKKLTNLLRY